MKIYEKEANSIITKSKLPEADYCINPYTGCMHNCVYCYARFMKRFTSHSEEWGDFIDVKVNSTELIKKKLKSLSKDTDRILIGSVTDAYQPLEKKYELTRSILKELVQVPCKVSILTKSDLVLRDLDILKTFKQLSIGITITSHEDNVRSIMEPNASSVEQRLHALKTLHDYGIHTYAFIGPILPSLTDLEAIFEAISGNVDEVWGEILNVRSGNWNDILKYYQLHFPNKVTDILKNVKNKQYWDSVEETFSSLCEQYHIPMVGFYRH